MEIKNLLKNIKENKLFYIPVNINLVILLISVSTLINSVAILGLAINFHTHINQIK
jgi:hypothetical protein